MNTRKNESIWLLIVFIAVVVILWGTCWLVTLKVMHNEQWSNLASFGEMFGSVNALFSGLALAGIIYAIILQRRELQLQAETQKKSEEALWQQIRQMQEQSQLQLRPFVILIKDVKSNKYMLWNAGNGTAINIRISVAVGTPEEFEIYDYSNKTSILTKDQTDFVEDTNPGILEERVFNIEFQDINKKEYILTGKLKNGRTELLSFDPCES